MARILVTPTWVAVLDFETRFPSALSGWVPRPGPAAADPHRPSTAV